MRPPLVVMLTPSRRPISLLIAVLVRSVVLDHTMTLPPLVVTSAVASLSQTKPELLSRTCALAAVVLRALLTQSSLP